VYSFFTFILIDINRTGYKPYFNDCNEYKLWVHTYMIPGTSFEDE
jgi:hypothetical protein